MQPIPVAPTERHRTVFRFAWTRLAKSGLTMLGVLSLSLGLPGISAGQTFDDLYKAAKAEGSVSVFGGPSQDIRRELTEAFAKSFPDITLKYSGMSSNEAASKIQAEKRAGLSTVDIVLYGSGVGIRVLQPAGLLQPIRPLMIPAVAKDAMNWREGDFTFTDKKKEILVLLLQTSIPAMINTDLVKSGEVGSDQDLLDPKWRGKIVSVSPLIRGAGLANFRRLYDLYGPEFVQNFITSQKLVFSKDPRWVADSVAKGQYAIALGEPAVVVMTLMRRGVKNLQPLGSHDWKEPLVSTTGYGCLMVPKTPAHPAAARLFANWLLTRDGSYAFGKGSGSMSIRKDVPDDHVPDFLRIYDDAKYLPDYEEEAIKKPTEKLVRDLVKKIGEE